MTKLKCWKKISEKYDRIVFKKDGEKYRVYVGKKEGYLQDYEDWYIVHKSFAKDFKSKSQALKFANKYMKNHDKC